MLIALISDIHANHLALQACLAKAAALGVDRLVFLGDLVGYGAEPEEVVATVRDLAEQGAVVIKGNHDHAIADQHEPMNGAAKRAIDWTRDQLSAEAKTYLARLPMTTEDDDRLYVHADASAPAKWNYVTDNEDAFASINASARPIAFCGHVHVPMLYCLSSVGKITAHSPASDAPLPLSGHRRWLAVIGSVGQPRDGNPAAAFATYDTLNRSLVFRRAPYDVERASMNVRKAGLPDQLAMRLLKGQ